MLGTELPENSGLHDWQLGMVTISYETAGVIIQLISPAGKADTLCISGFTDVCFPRCEPWGAGCYVAASGIENLPDGRRRAEIELNSGDMLTIGYTPQTE